MTEFQTPRILLRPYRAEDFPHILRLQSDPEVMRYIRPAAVDASEVLERTQKWVQYAADNPGYGVWTLVLTGPTPTCIGYAVVRHIEFEPGREIEVGYTLDSTYWGKGLATEATKALVVYARDALGIQHLVAFTDVANHASNKVLEKCGFIQTGMARVYSADCLRWEKVHF